jgi:hypothetical protein
LVLSKVVSFNSVRYLNVSRSVLSGIGTFSRFLHSRHVQETILSWYVKE